MSVTWITLLVVNQEEGHIVNIKVSSYKNHFLQQKRQECNMFSDKELSSV